MQNDSNRSEERTFSVVGRKRRKKKPMMAGGPMIWYALAGLSILLSLYLFLTANPSSNLRMNFMALFVGLWAPMFGLLGLRVELYELRDELRRQLQGKK